MSAENRTLVYALLIGWWIGAVYPNAGIIGIGILGCALQICGSIRGRADG